MNGPFEGAVWGIDSSYDLLTPDEAQRFMDEGMGVYAQCLWTGRETPATANASLRNAANAGMLTVGYISLTANGQNGQWHVQQARNRIDGTVWEALAKAPLDLEKVADLPLLNWTRDVLPGLLYMPSLGKAKDVYTSLGYWNEAFSGIVAPADVGLWDASWFGHIPPTAAQGKYLYRPYGGFTEEQCWGTQYASPSVPESDGGDLFGQVADRDFFRLAVLLPPPPTAPEPEDYVTHFTQYFKSGKVWEIDVVPPPGASS